MNALLLNRDGFQTPADGWYQIAPLGEFGHAQAGVTQVVDAEACAAMANRFTEEAKAPNFAGLLVDFDHFSLDGEKKSEAAGWITALEARGGEVISDRSSVIGGESGNGSRSGAEAQGGVGLFAKIRWSDVGESAVKGGRYRFLSPVWTRADCADLGNGRVRPMRLLNAAVTNDPNLKGMAPLSNSGSKAEGCRLKAEGGEIGNANAQRSTSNAQLSTEDGEKRFKWVLGASPKDRHCPSCAGLAGKVHTMAEWDASGLRPGCGALYCQGNCHCALVPTDEPSGGAVAPGPLREVANTGWTDQARAASLAVRRSHAAARGGGGGRGGGGDNGDEPAQGDPDQEAIDALGGQGSDDWQDGVAGGVASHGPQNDAEQAAAELAADAVEHQDTPDGDITAADRAAQMAEDLKTDAAVAFQQSGLSGMTDEQKQTLSDSIGQKVRDGEALTPADEAFVHAGGMSAPGDVAAPPADPGADGILVDGGDVPPPSTDVPLSPTDDTVKQPDPPSKPAKPSKPGKPAKPVKPAGGGVAGGVMPASPAAARQAASLDLASQDYAQIYDQKGLSGMTQQQVDYLAARIGVKVRNGSPLSETETRFVKERGLTAAANRARR